jgi:hypothetical protein
MPHIIPEGSWAADEHAMYDMANQLSLQGPGWQHRPGHPSASNFPPSASAGYVDLELKPGVDCRLPNFFRHRWTTDEREYLLILKIFTVAQWPDVTDAINREFGFSLTEAAVHAQFEHVRRCCDEQIEQRVRGRDENYEVIRRILKRSGLDESEWGPQIPKYEWELDLEDFSGA